MLLCLPIHHFSFPHWKTLLWHALAVRQIMWVSCLHSENGHDCKVVRKEGSGDLAYILPSESTYYTSSEIPPPRQRLCILGVWAHSNKKYSILPHYHNVNRDLPRWNRSRSPRPRWPPTSQMKQDNWVPLSVVAVTKFRFRFLPLSFIKKRR